MTGAARAAIDRARACGREPAPFSPAGGVRLGVVVETEALDVDPPFEISFGKRDRWAVSRLAYALAIADKLTPRDEARGADGGGNRDRRR
jgi:hypothetical protein